MCNSRLFLLLVIYDTYVWKTVALLDIVLFQAIKFHHSDKRNFLCYLAGLQLNVRNLTKENLSSITKHILWVLKKTFSSKRFFLGHKTFF